MSNTKVVREQLLKQAGWREVRPDKWLPSGLYCVKCGRWSEPGNCNDLACPYCGSNMVEHK